MHHVAEQLPWQGIAAVVTRDDRVVLEGRTTSEVFGGEWGDVKGEIQKRCESHSEGGSLGRYVLWCCAVCPFWHGGPLWNRLVDRFCAGVDLKALPHGIDPLQLHFQLTHDPLSLSVDEFAWLLQNGLSSLDDLR